MIGALARLLPGPVRRALSRRAATFITSHGYIPFDAARFYAEDGLYTVHDQRFRHDPAFRDAYARGVQAGDGVDPHFEWRIHVALWAAATALGAEGDFVECGVNAGFVSSAIMRRLDWVKIPRQYYLVDTFAGPVLAQFSPAELAGGRKEVVEELIAAGSYVTDVARVRANFAEWPNAVVVQGAVPDVLPRIPARHVAFLHVDMNCSAPECAAVDYFWDRLSKSGVILLDDYAHNEYAEQKEPMDEIVRSRGGQVLALPTGQGLIVK